MKEKIFSITKKDLDVQTFCSGGPGGQHQNKTASGIRIVHKESGAVGESREERNQNQNKKIAFKRLVNSQKFKLWIQKKVFELTCDKKEIERKVDIEMREKNLNIEIMKNKKWIKYEEEVNE